MIASFSRALTEGLSTHQNTASFNAVLSETINSIYQASISD
jgi:fructose-bisphosphate aldolase class I